MRLLILILSVLGLTACTAVHIPTLPGPADEVNCVIKRSKSTEGTYKCTVEGTYRLKSVDPFGAL